MGRDSKSSSVDRQIDENLRKVYQKTIDEQLPDRFTELLKQLKDQDANNAQ